MSFAIDIILIIICVLTVFLGTRRGFVKTLMSLLSVIVALICSYTFTPMFADFLSEKFFMAPVAGSIADTLRSLVPEVDGQYDLLGLLNDMPQTLASILERYNINPEELKASVESLTVGGDESVTALAGMIAEPIVEMISTVVAFITIFVVLTVVLGIITAIINSVFKLPVLRGANTLLGFLLGVVTALVILFVYSSLVSALVVSLGSISPEWFGSDVIEGTLVVKFFAELDFFSILNNLIS